jgi:hypothetical protein
MATYSAFGLTIESDFEINAPVCALAGAADLSIRRGHVTVLSGRSEPSAEFLTVPTIGAFFIRAGQEVIVDLKPDADRELLRVLLSGRIMAYVLRQRSWFPLHASAVAIGDRAVLFLAPVGAGKSTTAATFHARGHEVLCDDVSPVRVVDGRCVVCRTNPQLRLLPDAAAQYAHLDSNASFSFDKHLFRLSSRGGDQHVPVAKIYLITEGGSLRAEGVPPFEAVTSLGRECFVRLGRAGSEMLRAHLADCICVASTTSIERLFRPRDLVALPRLVDFVERSLGFEQPR